MWRSGREVALSLDLVESCAPPSICRPPHRSSGWPSSLEACLPPLLEGSVSETSSLPLCPRCAWCVPPISHSLSGGSGRFHVVGRGCLWTAGVFAFVSALVWLDHPSFRSSLF